MFYNKKRVAIRLISLFVIFCLIISMVYRHAPRALATTESFTTAGDTPWVAPAGVTSVQVEVWGAGGGGGGSAGSGSGGGGGGAGAYSKKNTVSVTPGNSYTVHVGVKGGGAVGNAAGGLGADSYFIDSATVLAKGGAGGLGNGSGASNVAGGAAGSGIGDVKWSGGQGGQKGSTNGGGGGGGGGDSADGGAGSDGATSNTGGTAGVSGGGAGGNGGLGSSSPQNGFSGTQPGGGGGGGTNKTGVNTNGGDGADGKVILTYAQPASLIAFSNSTRTFIRGACNGTANVFTMEIQNASNTPTNPSSSTVIRVTSDSSSYQIYSDSNCTTPVSNGDFTYSTSENSKSVYIIDTGSGASHTLTGTRQSGDTLTTGTQSYDLTGPDKISFSNATRSLTAGACNGTANVFTMELQAGSTPTNPASSTVVRVTSNSPTYTIYSDSSCTTPVSNGDFTYSTSENSKSVYIIDTGTAVSYTLTGTRQSGDTLTTGAQAYSLQVAPAAIIRGGTVIHGGTILR